MRSRGWLALVAAVVVAGCWGSAGRADAFVYWTTDTAIGRANLDGTGALETFIAEDFPRQLAIDDRYIYWSDDTTNAIGRARLDGSGANPRFISGVSAGLAVDDRHIYWADPVGGAIGRANLDGSVVEADFITGTPGARGVAVDDRHVYWSVATGTIGRANLDGSGVEPGFIGGASTPSAVAVGDRHVYWSNLATGTIGRASLDGTSVDQDFVGGVTGTGGVAVDDQYVYWGDLGTDTVGRVRLDGTGIDRSFVAAGAGGPNGLAVDGGPAGTASPSTTSLAFGIQPLGTFGAAAALTITNSGHGNLEIDAARVTGAGVDDFLVSHDTCSQSTLTIGGTCGVGVRFGPSASGRREAMLAVASNDPGSPLAIALRGTAGPFPQGPAGAIGSRGPAGPPGPASDRLALALATDRLRARPRRRVTLRYATTTAAAIELRVMRGRRRIARVRANADAGRNAIRLRAPRRARRYRVEMIAATGDGQRATDSARLTVTRTRRER